MRTISRISSRRSMSSRSLWPTRRPDACSPVSRRTSSVEPCPPSSSTSYVLLIYHEEADHPAQVKKGKKYEFSSLDLKKKNARILESVQEIFLLSDE